MSQELSATTSFVESHTKSERSNVTGKRDRNLSLRHRDKSPFPQKRKYALKGEKVRANRERDGVQQEERYYVSRRHRPPASIRAGALISWSTRPDMLERSVETEFYSVCLTWHSLMHYFDAKLQKKRRNPNNFVTSIEVGMQNSGLASSLATIHFAAYPLATIPGAIFSVWHNLSGAAVAYLYRKKQSK